MARLASEYNRKRNFDITPEPAAEKAGLQKKSSRALRFVVQKHDARVLHYDFRLEWQGVLKSWAVPKGPSLDPAIKRMAIPTEDHPLSYAEFEGHIPQGQYGGGDVIVWDEGIWIPEDNPQKAFDSGKVKFQLIGEKLTGHWALIRTRGYGENRKEHWLLIKERDNDARPATEYDLLTARPESILSGALLPVDQTRPTQATDNNKTKNKAARVTNSKNGKVAAKTQAKTPQPNAVRSVAASKTTDTITAIPETFSPQLATLVNEPPAGDWLYEIKFDGYRMLARVLDGKVNLFTRNGNDWTEKLPAQVSALEALDLDNSWLDGEIVALKENGLPGFQTLQSALEARKSQDIIFYMFDAPFLKGEDLRDQPLETRRKKLKKIIPRRAHSLIRYSDAFEADHRSIVQSACAMSLEGVIGKRAGSSYVSRRSDDWIKLKCRLRQEFVIVGYTDPQGSRSGFGAVLLAVHKQQGSPELHYAGRVGTGFSTRDLNDLHKKMKPLERVTSPLATRLTGAQSRGVHWIKPKLIGEVEFSEWTDEGILRQASFVALRTDKPVKDIIREQPETLKNTPPAKKQVSEKNASPPATPKHSDSAKVNIAGIPISHPGRVIDITRNDTKLDLAAYYEQIAEYMLPHLKSRPVSLLRAPDGIDGQQFFQKHSDNRSIPHITRLDKKLDPENDPLMTVDNLQALVGCVQMNTIEFHTWGSTTRNMEAPDRLVLDLDPDPSLPWRSVVEAAKLTLAVLDELKLTSYLKTTGGKGIHILVPLTPDASWDYVKAFSKAIAGCMAKQIPDRFVAKMGPKNRIGKIFIDYLRNSRGASTVAAYSVRARPGLPVSVPIVRDELNSLSRPDQWHIGNLTERLDKLNNNPWAPYLGEKFKNQKINAAMWKKLGTKAPTSL